MTNDEIDKLEAGPELDALVAEKIFNDTPPRGYGVPDYSTDIAAAWEVVKKLKLYVGPGGCDDWMASRGPQFGSYETSYASTVELAICREALKDRLA